MLALGSIAGVALSWRSAPADASIPSIPTVPGGIGIHVRVPREAENCTVTSGTRQPGPVVDETPGLPGDKPSGLIALQIYKPGPNPPFSDTVFSDPFISGVDLLTQWCNLEPRPGVFNWLPLDQTFAQADAAGYFVVVTVIPGFETPAWALRGVRTVTSSWAYHNRDVGIRRLPMPWNTTYLNRWYAFLRALAGRYGNDPQFRMIEVGGPTSVSTEMSLPDATSGDGGLPIKYHGSDIAMWEDKGYTPTRYVNAWRRTIAAYHQIFPKQYLALSTFPGLPVLNSTTDNDTSLALSTPLQVVAAGEKYRSQLDLQEDGLSGASNMANTGYNDIKAHCGQVVTGLQTSAPPNDDPLSPALTAGQGADLDFLEIYQFEVKNDAALLDAFQLPKGLPPTLPDTTGCVPLALTGVKSTGGPGVTGVTATTDLTLASHHTEFVNVYELSKVGGRPVSTRVGECDTSACTVSVKPGIVPTRFQADVGVPDTLPYASQALVSATVTVDTSGPASPLPGGGRKPICKKGGSACL
jgi:hypothetical protein